MFASFQPTNAWTLAPKQRLAAFLAQGPARTRVAPSPTGHVHLGTLRTALHNALAAKASGGTWLLRIDDTDIARNDPAHVDLIHHSLDRLGLIPDAVFHQSVRRDVHLAAANVLLDSGWAVCDGDAIRLAPTARGLAPDRFCDLASGVCAISDTLLDHTDGLVLVRSDGFPTYHLASIVDDIDHGITLILRGMDHLSNVPKQVLIARALAAADWPGAQTFCDQVMLAHVGLILKDGKKLSKRDGASNLALYLDDGVAPAALLQWALPLGWGHPDPQFDRTWPRIGLADMPTLFAQGGLRASNCALDLGRLAAIGRKWAAAGRAARPG